MIAIGEAARQSGVSIEAIRFYEREGVVPRPPRTESGRRVYSQAAVSELGFIRRCRDLGFPLAEVRALLALSRGERDECSTVRDLGLRHLEEVRSKIAELRRLEMALEELTENCASGSVRCPMLEALRS